MFENKNLNESGAETVKVSVIGLGYVGLTLATTLAEIGFLVTGVEVNPSVLECLRSGKAHFFEPGLDQRLRSTIKSKRFQFSNDLSPNLESSVYVITVGTPLDKEGLSRMDMIENAALQVAKNLKARDLVVLRSTVKLGVTRNVVKPILDSVGVDYDLAFCPERTLEGKAMSELRSLPQIVGGASHSAGLRASHFFQMMTPTVVRVSDLETAEMIKLVDNAQRDVAFAYANEVAMACDSVGISAIEVIESGKLGYPRTNLPVPGPVGGPCLEKDSHIFAEGLVERGFTPNITLASRRLNEEMPGVVANFLFDKVVAEDKRADNLRIVLAGLAFKGSPETDDLRGTMAVPFYRELKNKFTKGRFFGYDPIVSGRNIESLGLEALTSLDEAFNEADLVLFLNNHSCFTDLPLHELSNIMCHGGIIYDLWSNYDPKVLDLKREVRYLAFGSHGTHPTVC